MADKKYSLKMFEIVDEMGDLKFVGKYKTDVIPQINDQIAVLGYNKNNQLIRIYYVVKIFLHYAEFLDNSIVQTNEIGELQVEKISEEVIE